MYEQTILQQIHTTVLEYFTLIHVEHILQLSCYSVLLEVSKFAMAPSFSSASSFDDMVPVDDVRAILLMSPTV